MRCWFLRSICDRTDLRRRRASGSSPGSTCPCGVLTSTSLDVARPAWRSSSRSRTMIGYSLPRSRNSAACVPATLVRMVLATLVALRPSSAAFGAIDAHRQLRPSFVAAEPRVGDARASCRAGPSASCATLARVVEVLAADLERQPAAAVVAAADRKRFIWWLPPDGVGADDDARDARRAAAADPARSDRSMRLRSSFGTSRCCMLPRFDRPPPPPPKPPPPPPALTMIVVASGTSWLIVSSSRASTASVRSMRVPDGQLGAAR